jgi:predicted nucleic acid-binding protein
LVRKTSQVFIDINHPKHRFWPDTLEVNDAMTKVRQVTGHNQITDAYLLALAISRRGTLVTLDKSVANLMLPSAGASGRRAGLVILTHPRKR